MLPEGGEEVGATQKSTERSCTRGWRRRGQLWVDGRRTRSGRPQKALLWGLPLCPGTPGGPGQPFLRVMFLKAHDACHWFTKQTSDMLKYSYQPS